MIRLLRRWWWKRQRSTDLALLWPSCKEHAPSIAIAREIFMLHASQDPAWLREYGEELWNYISRLE